MDIATIAGIGAGTVIVAIAILIGGDVGSFVNLPSILIVIGGGFAATIIRFPLANIFSAFALGGAVAFTHKKVSPMDMINEITTLAEVIRKEGPLGLENVEISQELLQKGSQMVADGYELDIIRTMLERERDLFLERLDEGARIYKALGDAAPAFGMIGTLVGLVQMLSTMDDPSTIGPSMAVALLTTLYGAIIANLIALPISDKLNNKAAIEEVNQTLALDGILQLRENKSPQLIREALIAYLPSKERAAILADAEAAAA
ncbi:MAG: MotA/TolQ/ExbB proton channel family protein [Pseudomonadota bacterium]